MTRDGRQLKRHASGCFHLSSQRSLAEGVAFALTPECQWSQPSSYLQSRTDTLSSPQGLAGTLPSRMLSVKPFAVWLSHIPSALVPTRRSLGSDPEEGSLFMTFCLSQSSHWMSCFLHPTLSVQILPSSQSVWKRHLLHDVLSKPTFISPAPFYSYLNMNISFSFHFVISPLYPGPFLFIWRLFLLLECQQFENSSFLSWS